MGVYPAAQKLERHFKKHARRVKGNQRLHGQQAIYATHSGRKMTWTIPSISHMSSWAPALVVILLILCIFPRMPAVPASLPNSPTQTMQSSASGLAFPPTTLYDPPQWFDPPGRDRIFWLDNLFSTMSHTARFSWDVFTVNLPANFDADTTQLCHRSPSIPHAASRKGPTITSSTDLWPMTLVQTRIAMVAWAQLMMCITPPLRGVYRSAIGAC